MTSRATTLDYVLPSYYGGPQPETHIPPILELYRWRRRQWQRQEAVRESQCKRLMKTISRAYTQVRYYRRLFDSVGISPKDVSCVEDLDSVPITDRQTIQTRPLQEVTASNVDLEKCIRRCTSGSIGRPLMMYMNQREDCLIDMTWAFAFIENGQRLLDKCADFHSNPNKYAYTRWFERVGIWRRATVSALTKPVEQMALLRRVRPDIIRGNPDDLREVVSVIQRNGIDDIKPRLVFTMGAFLDDRFRALIKSVLGADVFDYYGSAELGCIAWECSMHEGYHINSDSVVLEVIDSRGNRVRPGESGRLVCTGLIANTMPFIRYDTGDVGIVEDRKCRCGRTFPTLSRLQGRAYHFLVLRDGSRVAPFVLSSQIKNIRGIEQYRVIQESVTQIDVEIVPDKEWTENARELVQALLKRITHGEAVINVKICGSIPRDASGKIQSIVSKVKHSI